MINILPGRYHIFFSSGSSVVVELDQKLYDVLYRKLNDKSISEKGYCGLGWIAPGDYDKYPVSGLADRFIGTYE